MLRDFTIKNFKSYKNATLPLASLTVMIGANASGKSNAIESLRFASWLAQGQKLSSIQYSVNSGDQIVRGTTQNLSWDNKFEFGFSCNSTDALSLTWNISIEDRDDGLHIVKETLATTFEPLPYYDLDQPSVGQNTDVGVAYNNFARGGKKPHVTCIDQMAIFSQLTSPATFSSNHKSSRKRIPLAAHQIENTLSNILVLDPNPQLMRGYAFPSDDKLRGDGSNISAVLYSLCGRPRPEAEIKDKLESNGEISAASSLLSLIRSLPEQNIEGIKFIHEPRGGVMVSLVESFGQKQKEFDASLLSDGTLRVLSIATALLSTPEGTMVVIEEIDNGVHPSRAKHLLESIRNIAEERSLRVLMSTHNPALLDALPDDSIKDVVFCYRSLDDGSSQIMRLSDSVSFPEMIAQDTLGGLLTSGVLDRYAKHKSTPQHKKAAALEWLKSVE